MLYPLKFKPILKQTIWGGDKLAYKSNDPKVKESIGESWEISGVQDNISVVSEGALEGNSLQELTEIYMGDLVGDKIYEKFGIEFPLLIKYIDARDNLSIQVHPDDATAKARHNAYGKTEMWYLVGADRDAELIMGFNKDTDKSEYLTAQSYTACSAEHRESRKRRLFFHSGRYGTRYLQRLLYRRDTTNIGYHLPDLRL